MKSLDLPNKQPDGLNLTKNNNSTYIENCQNLAFVGGKIEDQSTTDHHGNSLLTYELAEVNSISFSYFSDMKKSLMIGLNDINDSSAQILKLTAEYRNSQQLIISEFQKIKINSFIINQINLVFGTFLQYTLNGTTNLENLERLRRWMRSKIKFLLLIN